jgi:hypothetical protein
MLLSLFVRYQRALRVYRTWRTGDAIKARYAETEAYDRFVDHLKSASFWAFRKPA